MNQPIFTFTVNAWIDGKHTRTFKGIRATSSRAAKHSASIAMGVYDDSVKFTAWRTA